MPLQLWSYSLHGTQQAFIINPVLLLNLPQLLQLKACLFNAAIRFLLADVLPIHDG
jgi:hypothetical protein